MEKENFNKTFIINLLRVNGKMTISQIAKAINTSRPTVYLHLENLEREGFISRTKDPDRKGAPVSIELIQKSIEEKDRQNLIKFLKMIRDSPGLTQQELREKHLAERISDAYTSATFRGLVDKKIFLTEAGKKFLAENT